MSAWLRQNESSCLWATLDHLLSCLYDKKTWILIFSQQEVLPSFTMLSICSEIHSVKCINHIKWCVGLLLAAWVKCIPCQTRQPAGPLRKILIDTAVAFNQLGKHESSLRCVQACRCQQKGKQSGGGGGGGGGRVGGDAKTRREEDKFYVSESRKPPHLHPEQREVFLFFLFFLRDALTGRRK